MTDTKTILITGSAKRVGAAIARQLHSAGHRVIIHYRHSKTEAENLCNQLNSLRPDSAIAIQADLADQKATKALVNGCVNWSGRLDALINNASDFYPTPFEQATQADWDRLFASNCRGPYFLTQAALPHLTKQQGCVINITDTRLQGELLDDHSLYYMAKAGLSMMTKSLEKSLKDQGVQMHEIKPGSVLPPGTTDSEEAYKIGIECEKLINRTG